MTNGNGLKNGNGWKNWVLGIVAAVVVFSIGWSVERTWVSANAITQVQVKAENLDNNLSELKDENKRFHVESNNSRENLRVEVAELKVQVTALTLAVKELTQELKRK